MQSTRHTVQLQYAKKEVRKLLDTANQHRVDTGGRYRTQSAAIHIGLPPDTALAPVDTAGTMGTFYFDWTTLRLHAIECGAGQQLDDLLGELGTLEEMAFGKKKYGR